MNQRSAIQLSEAEVWDFLAEPHTIALATLRSDGTPHLVAMWFALDGHVPVFWSYGTSQKITNLRRDSRLTCLVEAGASYTELRGVELSVRAVLFEDHEEVLRIGALVASKHGLPHDRASMEAAGRKRIGVRVEVAHITSWDHRKMGH